LISGGSALAAFWSCAARRAAASASARWAVAVRGRRPDVVSSAAWVLAGFGGFCADDMPLSWRGRLRAASLPFRLSLAARDLCKETA
jgi:hypothetical protein